MVNSQIHNIVRKHFRFMPGEDNYPMLAKSGRSREALARMINYIGARRGVEVGVRRGGFSMLICKENPGAHMFCVDPWMAYRHLSQEKQDDYYAQTVANMAPYNATVIRKTSMDALADFDDESLDFVHIDGNHEFDYVAPDIIFWSKKLRTGGLMMCLDYCCFHWSGVMKAVDAYTHCHRIEPWYVTKDRLPTAFWFKP